MAIVNWKDATRWNIGTLREIFQLDPTLTAAQKRTLLRLSLDVVKHISPSELAWGTYQNTLRILVAATADNPDLEHLFGQQKSAFERSADDAEAAWERQYGKEAAAKEREKNKRFEGRKKN